MMLTLFVALAPLFVGSVIAVDEPVYAYVPPRTYIVSPATAFVTAAEIVANGWSVLNRYRYHFRLSLHSRSSEY